MLAAPVLGPWVRALVDVIESGRTRKKPHASAANLARQTASFELRAIMTACAKHAISHVSLDEYLLAERDIGDSVPSEDAFFEGKVVVGHSPGGDIFVVELTPKGKNAPVWRIAHDEEWTTYREASDLESFLRKYGAAAKKAGQKSDVLLALEKAKRETPAARALAKAAATSTKAIAWLPTKVKPETFRDSPTVLALKKLLPNAWFVVASPQHTIVIDDRDDSKKDRDGNVISIASGTKVRALGVPPLRELRCSTSPDGAFAVLGSPLQLYFVDIARGNARALPWLGWVADVSFVANDLFVVATAGGWQEPMRGSADVKALLAKQKKDPGGRLCLESEARLHVFALPKAARGVPECVQRVGGSAPTMGGFLGRYLVLRKPAEGEREKKSTPRTWVYVVNNQRLVFLAALPKDPGNVFERKQRIYGEDGYELVHLEAAAKQVPPNPATWMPDDCSAKPGRASDDDAPPPPPAFPKLHTHG
ncbi:MAG: hypothetical protein H0T89_35660 [Deltaproteobacteria bacterium]|nr:hypothetical protein [Deltaproteobacteria bacterium]MDQ3296578.1 SMI1/KNR4 family protein [Myxococcota bacterium]